MASGENLTFPFLAADSFDSACKVFVRRVDAAGGAQSLGWLAVEYLASEVGVKQKANGDIRHASPLLDAHLVQQLT